MTSTETERVTDRAALAEKAINAHREAAENLRNVCAALATVEGERAIRKVEAIVRLTQADNPATPGKKYSASQAADFAQLDPDYAEYKERVTRYTLMRQEAEGNLATAKLVAQLAVVVFRAEAGLI